MNSRIYKICSAVVRHKKLPLILKKTGIPDYFDLQIQAGAGMLCFSDDRMDSNTIVSLSDKALEEYENYKRKKADHLLSLYAAITSTAAIVIEAIYYFISIAH